MPRAGWVKPEEDHRLSDHLAFAVLTRVFPAEVVDKVIADVGRLQRRNRILPSRTVVYYVLGLALFSHSSYEEVIRLVIGGQAWSSGWSQSPAAPTKAALYKARQRLGPEPLQELFDRVATPMTTAAGGTGFYRGWRVLGIDGISLDVPATPANRAEFADAAAVSSAPHEFPKVRVVGLTELGTGAIVGAGVGGSGRDEGDLISDLLSRLPRGHLLLGGAELYSPKRWDAALATGAEFLWELPPDAATPVGHQNLIEHVSGAGAGAGAGRAEHVRRFITTIPRSENLPSAEVVQLFANKRSVASAFDEFRAHRNSPPVVLRSKLPPGVRQEIYGYLCVHYAMRWIMNAPLQHGSDGASMAESTGGFGLARIGEDLLLLHGTQPASPTATGGTSPDGLQEPKALK